MWCGSVVWWRGGVVAGSVELWTEILQDVRQLLQKKIGDPFSQNVLSPLHHPRRPFVLTQEKGGRCTVARHGLLLVVAVLTTPVLNGIGVGCAVWGFPWPHACWVLIGACKSDHVPDESFQAGCFRDLDNSGYCGNGVVEANEEV